MPVGQHQQTMNGNIVCTWFARRTFAMHRLYLVKDYRICRKTSLLIITNWSFPFTFLFICFFSFFSFFPRYNDELRWLDGTKKIVCRSYLLQRSPLSDEFSSFLSFVRSFFSAAKVIFRARRRCFFYHFILPLPGTALCCSVVSEIGFRKIFIDCVFARLSFIYSVAFTLIRSFGEGRKTKKGNHGGQLYPN